MPDRTQTLSEWSKQRGEELREFQATATDATAADQYKKDAENFEAVAALLSQSEHQGEDVEQYRQRHGLAPAQPPAPVLSDEEHQEDEYCVHSKTMLGCPSCLARLKRQAAQSFQPSAPVLSERTRLEEIAKFVEASAKAPYCEDAHHEQALFLRNLASREHRIGACGFCEGEGVRRPDCQLCGDKAREHRGEEKRKPVSADEVRGILKGYSAPEPPEPDVDLHPMQGMGAHEAWMDGWAKGHAAASQPPAGEVDDSEREEELEAEIKALNEKLRRVDEARKDLIREKELGTWLEGQIADIEAESGEGERLRERLMEACEERSHKDSDGDEYVYLTGIEAALQDVLPLPSDSQGDQERCKRCGNRGEIITPCPDCNPAPTKIKCGECPQGEMTLSPQRIYECNICPARMSLGTYERSRQPAPTQVEGEDDFCERCNGSFGEVGCQFCNPVGHAQVAQEIPADYWREVPCGHPADPVAMYNAERFPVCHCGCLLDTAGLLPAPPEAPGPLSHCQKCGCHVAIPPFTEQPEGGDEEDWPEELYAVRRASGTVWVQREVDEDEEFCRYLPATYQGRDYALVSLPMCATESGVPKAGVRGGFTNNEVPTDPDEILRSALAQIRQKGIEHHGRDLLPDADDPSPDNWFLVCVEKESAVYQLHPKRSATSQDSSGLEEIAEEQKAYLVTRLRQAEDRASKAEAERDEAIRKRDLAIAHDRQPYPTAAAYEKTCAALEKHRVRAERAETALGELRKEFEQEAETYARKRAKCKAEEAADRASGKLKDGHSYEATWNYYEGLAKGNESAARSAREKAAELKEGER